MTTTEPVPNGKNSDRGRLGQVIGGAGSGSVLLAMVNSLPAYLQEPATLLSPWLSVGVYWGVGKLHVKLNQRIDKRRRKAKVAEALALLNELAHDAHGDQIKVAALRDRIHAAKVADAERLIESLESEVRATYAVRSAPESPDAANS
jgi:hypothetical protein